MRNRIALPFIRFIPKLKPSFHHSRISLFHLQALSQAVRCLIANNNLQGLNHKVGHDDLHRAVLDLNNVQKRWKPS